MGEIRNSFNVEETLQIKKKAKRKAIKWTLALVFIFEMMAIIIVLDASVNINGKIIVIAITQIIIILAGFAMAYYWYRFMLGQEKGKISAALAGGCLSKKKWTQVIPVRANEYQEFMVQRLKANFFAKLREDGDIIDVYVQLHNENEYIPLEKISKNWFLNYYSILEESEKEPEEKSND